jgi:hypothetical protein
VFNFQLLKKSGPWEQFISPAEYYSNYNSHCLLSTNSAFNLKETKSHIILRTLYAVYIPSNVDISGKNSGVMGDL